MKKVFYFVMAIVVLVAFVLAMSSCNMGIGPGKFTFEGIHLTTYDGKSACLEVKKWYESDTGVEVTTTDGNSIFASEGTYILFKDKCPICGEKPGEKPNE